MFNEIVMTDLTKEQKKALQKGKNIRLKPYQLKGGKDYLHLTMPQFKKWKSNQKKEKGMILKMTKEQVGANPLLVALAETVLPMMLEKSVEVIIDKLSKPKKKTQN